MDTSLIISSLTELRDQWLKNADTLTQTINLIRNSASINQVTTSVMHVPLTTVTQLTQLNGDFQDSLTVPTKKHHNVITSTSTVDARIIAILKKANRFMFRSEIQQAAAEAGHPFKKPIATALSSLKKDMSKGIVMKKIGHNMVVWGFEMWTSIADGEIEPEHMYKKYQRELL